MDISELFGTHYYRASASVDPDPAAGVVSVVASRQLDVAQQDERTA